MLESKIVADNGGVVVYYLRVPRTDSFAGILFSVVDRWSPYFTAIARLRNDEEAKAAISLQPTSFLVASY